jgi:hypothetical protein
MEEEEKKEEKEEKKEEASSGQEQQRSPQSESIYKDLRERSCNSWLRQKVCHSKREVQLRGRFS